MGARSPFDATEWSIDKGQCRLDPAVQFLAASRRLRCAENASRKAGTRAFGIETIKEELSAGCVKSVVNPLVGLIALCSDKRLNLEL